MATGPVQEPIRRAAVVPEDLGHVGVVGYEYTSWGAVFPELKALTQAVTGKRVTFGLATAWLSQRHMVGQYLAFCGRRFPLLAIEGAAAAGNNLMDALDAVREQLPEILRGVHGTSDPTPVLERELRDRLRLSLPHYLFILENHAWLKHAPLGAVPVVSDGTRYRYQPRRVDTSTATPRAAPIQTLSVGQNPFPAAALLANEALRLYPVITSSSSGKPAFLWVNVDLVTLGQDETVRQVVASMQLPLSAAPGRSWGMLRGAGEDPAAVARRWRQQDAPGLWNGVPVRWEGDSWRSLWSCVDYAGDERSGIPKALLYPSAVAASGEGPGVEIEIACPDLPAEPAATLRPPHQTVDVLLVPVGYEDAKVVDVVVGGEPMWPEPLTDRILSSLSSSFG